jgi:hypothetical protein
VSDEPSGRELAERLYRELEATEELPIDHRANRWLGEAQAVAGEIRDASDEVRRRGATQVVELLESVEETGSEEPDEHVERALSLAERLSRDV